MLGSLIPLMFPPLRKSLLLFLTAVIGIAAGLLVRFAFGSSLQWQSAASIFRPLLAPEKADTAHATVTAPAPIPAASATLIKLNAIAGRDYAALTRLLEGEIDGELEGIHLRHTGLLISQMMELDPQRTLAWVRQHIFGRAAESWAFTEWWRKSPAAAEVWAATNAPEMLQRVKSNPVNITKEELARLLKEDPAQIEALLSQGGRQREVMMLDLATVRAEQNGAEAFTWARSLTHADERDTALQGVFNAWAKSDPRAAAAAWSFLPRIQRARPVIEEVAGIELLAGAALSNLAPIPNGQMGDQMPMNLSPVIGSVWRGSQGSRGGGGAEP